MNEDQARLTKALRIAFEEGYKKGVEDGRREGGQVLENAMKLLDAEGPTSVNDVLLENLYLSERPSNCLLRAKVHTVAQLVSMSEDDLRAITNFGQKSLDEVVLKLAEYNLTLRQE